MRVRAVPESDGEEEQFWDGAVWQFWPGLVLTGAGGGFQAAAPRTCLVAHGDQRL